MDKLVKDFTDKGRYYQQLARWASAFNQLGIQWQYTGSSWDRIPGPADFYLPKLKTHFRAFWESVDEATLEMYEHFPHTTVLGYSNGQFQVIDAGESYSLEESCIARCKKCREFFFFNCCGDFTCRRCGEYDGDHHLINFTDGYDGVSKLIRW